MALDPWPLTTLQARHFIFQDKPLSLAVKNLPAIQEIHILSLRQESPGGGNGNLLQYSCQKISRTEQPGGLQSLGSQIHRQNWSNWACINLLYHEIPQKTLESLLQHYSSKASILQHLAFLIVQLSHPYMTTGKTIALTRWTFVGKVMSLFFNMLSKVCQSFSSKEQVSFNFMTAITFCSDFGAQANSLSLFPLFPCFFAMKWWDQMP